MKILLLGATGQTGSLLLQLLCNHPEVSNITALSTSNQGTAITDEFVLANKHKLSHTHYIGLDDIEDDYDIVFSALPHGVSASSYQTIYQTISKAKVNEQYKTTDTPSVISNLSDTHPLHNTAQNGENDTPTKSTPNFIYIDLSADFRFRSIDTYLSLYEDTQLQKNVFLAKSYSKSVYGLSEIQRNEIAKASIIACPGCYPTSILIPLIPILRYVVPSSPITISSISGISGAGSNPSKDTMFINRSESLMPYAPGRSHRHYFEIQEQLKNTVFSDIDFTFTPHLAPLSQGMLSTIHIPLHPTDIERAIEALYAQYIEEPFVTIHTESTDTPTNTRNVRNTNNIHIGIHKERDGLILFSAIDNIWKGAVGQAIQNFNIRCGFDETTGLIHFAR